MSENLARLRALESTFVKAMNDKDLDGVMAAYAPGNSLFVFDVVGPPSAHVGWKPFDYTVMDRGTFAPMLHSSV